MGRLKPLAVWLLLAGCSQPAPTEAPAARPPTPPPAKPAGVAPVAFPAPQGNETYSARRTVELKPDRARPSELWTTPDEGQNWTNHGPVDPSRGVAAFAAPRDGRYGVLFVPVSDGRREYTPGPSHKPDRTVVVDTVPPVVEVKVPNGGELLGAGRSTVVEWVARDPNLAPAGIEIEVAPPESAAWVTVARDVPNTGQYHWDIRLATSGRFRLRVTARDLAGNAGSDLSDGEILVDGLPPDLRIDGPLTANELPARLAWTGGDLGAAGLRRVSLYVTRDNGQTWQFHGDDEDLASPYLLKELDGVYGLRLVGADNVGNANPAPTPGTAPQAVLVLDRTRPEAALLSPQGGGFLAGAPVDLRWSAKDNLELRPNPVSLYYSDDGGRTWKEIVREVANDGYHPWTAPKAPGPDYRVKLAVADLAGNVREVASERFGIDSAIPEAVAKGPDRANSNTVLVAYELKNVGAALVKRVTLYYRPENVKEWTRYGDDGDAASPVAFSKADGRYELYVACATESGMKSDFVQKPPVPATAPQVVLTIDTSAPQVALESFKGNGVVRSGLEAKVLWRLVEANPEPTGATVYHSPDGGGTWNVVASQLDPTKGSHTWVVPRSPGSRHRVRVVVFDKFGNKGQAESERPFTIDDDLPAVTILEKPPVIGRSTRVRFRYKAADPTSAVESVRLMGRAHGNGKPYQALAESAAAEGTLEAEVAGEGNWAFAVVATDVAGHVTRDLAKDARADFICAVDTTPPAVELKKSLLPNGALTYLNPLWEAEWVASDKLTPGDRLGVRVALSSDGGRTWQALGPREANRGRADLRSFVTAGRKYRVRVTAIDEAGLEAEAESPDFDPGDIPTPTLSIRVPDGARPLPVGGSLAVTWSTADASIKNVTLEISADGQKWTAQPPALTPTVQLPVPAQPGRYQVRATARDSVNRVVTSNVVTFDAVLAVEQLRIAVAPNAEPTRPVRVSVEPRAAVRAAQEMRLEYFDGKEWRKLQDVTGAEFHFPAPGVVGDYLVRVVFRGTDGREQTSNEARLTVAERGAGKGFALLNFRGGEVYPGGKGQVVAVRSDGFVSDLRVELSDQGGKEGTWREVSKDQFSRVSGGLLWRRLPAVTGKNFRIRVTGKDASGATIADQSERDFAIDSAAPKVVVSGRREEGGGLALEYKFEDSISPVKQVFLYVRKAGQGKWELYNTYEPTGELTFTPHSPGDYELFVAARSDRGIGGDEPPMAAPPQAAFKAAAAAVVSPAGRLSLKTTLPDRLKGGSAVQLTWQGPETRGKVQITLLTDGRRQTIAKDLPPAGTYTWTVHRMDARGCTVLVEQAGAADASRKFEIDSSPPAIQDVEIEIPRR